MKKRMITKYALAVAALITACCLNTANVKADSHYWVYPSATGYWYYTSGWSLTDGGAGGVGPPATAGDYAYLTQSGATDMTVYYYNPDYQSLTLGNIYIDGTGDGIMTLHQKSYSHTLYGAYEYVGYSGTGIHQQGLSTVSLTNYLYLGYNAGADGTYELSNSGTLSANRIYLGYNGKGTFTQTGGTNAITYLYFNTNDYSNYGTYTLNGGTLNVANMSNRGAGGANSVFYWNGGSLNPLSSSLYIAVDDFYFVSEATGSLNKTFNSSYSMNVDKLIVGLYGTATFTQNGAYCTATDYLSIGPQGTGTYNLQSGTLGANSARLIMGYDHYGNSSLATMNQTGGTAVFGTSLSNIGYAYDTERGTSAVATYNLSGSTSSLTTDILLFGQFYHSYGSMSGTGDAPHVAGYFNQSGGSHTVNSEMRFGDYYFEAGASVGEPLATLDAVYAISGGSLHSKGNIVMGSYGYVNPTYTSTPDLHVAFDQTGGEVTVDGELQVGKNLYDASYNLDGGSLTAATELVREGGLFQHDNGSNTVTSILTVESNGTYNLTGGSLTAGSVIVNDGRFEQTGGILNATTFTQNGGTVDGVLQNQNTFRYYGGSFAGRLWNQGSVSLYADFTAENGIQNDNYLYVGSKRKVTANGAGLENNNSVVLSGGTLLGNGPIMNLGTITADEGTIGGSAGFTNFGQLTQTTGTLTLAGTGINSNLGTISLDTGYQLRLTGSGLENSGTLDLNGALVSGSGALVNLSGGTVSGPGTIITSFANTGGRLLVYPGTTNISQSFSNSGLIQLQDFAASLTGGTVTNTGTIEGYGQVNNDIANNGIIEALGGTLNMSGGVANNSGGMIATGVGSKVLVSGGLASNDGLINLTGGTFDNNGRAMINNSTIAGYGTLRTGGLDNAGDVTMTGATSTINGAVTNSGTFEVAYDPVIFTDDFTNYGTFKSTSTTVTFAGIYTENGAYISDPAINYISDMVIGTTGYLVGSEVAGEYDKWYLSNNFENHSEQNMLWNTVDALFGFVSGNDGLHDLYLTGSDVGAVLTGYNNNFAWGYFDIAAGNSVSLLDGNGETGGAMYVEVITGASLLDGLVANIAGDLNIYYMPWLAANAYLQGLTYEFFSGSGKLIPVSEAPVPIPGSVWLLGGGFLGLLGLRRNRNKSA